MALVIQQIPIRLQVSTASAPPVAPIDYNTGLPPEAWRTQTLAVQLGVFDVAGNPVDLSDFAYVQLVIQDSPESLVPLVVKQVDAPQITDVIAVGAWRAGIAQNAQFDVSAAEMDINLLAQRSREIWLAVVGYTDDDAPVILGAGAFTVSLASASLPATPPRYTSRHAQETDAGDLTVTPTAAIHTEILTIEGSAREVSCILGINGVPDGARLYLDFVEPATPDIIINLKSGIGTNPTLYTVTTGSVLNGQIALYYDANDATWVVERVTFPAVAY